MTFEELKVLIEDSTITDVKGLPLTKLEDQKLQEYIDTFGNPEPQQGETPSDVARKVWKWIWEQLN